MGGRCAIVPLINNQRSIHPQPNPVVHPSVEAVAAGRETQTPAPTYGKVIGGQARRRRTISPIEVYGHIVAHQDRRAA